MTCIKTKTQHILIISSKYKFKQSVFAAEGEKKKHFAGNHMEQDLAVAMTRFQKEQPCLQAQCINLLQFCTN